MALYSVRHDVHILRQFPEFLASTLAYTYAVVSSGNGFCVGIQPAQRAQQEHCGHKEYQRYHCRRNDTYLAYEPGLLFLHDVYL